MWWHAVGASPRQRHPVSRAECDWRELPQRYRCCCSFFRDGASQCMGMEVDSMDKTAGKLPDQVELDKDPLL